MPVSTSMFATELLSLHSALHLDIPVIRIAHLPRMIIIHVPSNNIALNAGAVTRDRHSVNVTVYEQKHIVLAVKEQQLSQLSSSHLLEKSYQ